MARSGTMVTPSPEAASCVAEMQLDTSMISFGRKSKRRKTSSTFRRMY